ncbi:MAG: glycosyltransferase [Clostridia bacterium]|nr:glycosyltransferase [Clostridia bacterium]
MKKQILVIGPGMEIGGVERGLLGLLDAIDYDQFDVDLFLFCHTGEFMPYINPKANLLPEYRPIALINDPIARLFYQGHWYMAFLRLICKLYGDQRAKRCHTTTISTLLCRKIVSKRIPPFPKEYDYALGFFLPHDLLNNKVCAKVKIGWVHTDYTNRAEKPDTVFMLSMWAKLDYIACVSEGVRRSFCAVFPAVAAKTVTVENILSPALIQSQAEEFDASAEMPGDGRLRILSVGRFCTAKAFDRVPEVCRQLLEQGCPVRWYLIGYGPDETLIRRKIQEFQANDSVVILGKKKNPYPYMKRCDLYAQPSRYEGRAVTVTEAQILHKPVLITRYETSAEQLREGVDGFICEQGVDGIAEGVRYLAEHPEVRKRFMENTGRLCYENTDEIKKIWALRV